MFQTTNQIFYGTHMDLPSILNSHCSGKSPCFIGKFYVTSSIAMLHHRREILIISTHFYSSTFCLWPDSLTADIIQATHEQIQHLIPQSCGDAGEPAPWRHEPWTRHQKHNLRGCFWVTPFLFHEDNHPHWAIFLYKPIEGHCYWSGTCGIRTITELMQNLLETTVFTLKQKGIL